MEMKFNTAILYDVENLIGGYGNADMLSNLSLKEIFEAIEQKVSGKIAIQRAYANWSDRRLGILRTDVVQLGIEPIQMFGFGKGSNKNASDIQLAIDAIDIAFTRSVIEVFVIVSGDGGFSFLAKKLHEYGKLVIGCAYERTTNRVFESVCDEFVWIAEPQEEGEKPRRMRVEQISNDPLVHHFSRRHKPLRKYYLQEIEDSILRIVDFLTWHNRSKHLFSRSGLNISIFSQLLNYRLVDFNYYKYGFARFTDLIRYGIRQSKCKLVHKAPSEYRLVFREVNPKGYEDTGFIEAPGEVHSPELYQLLLKKNYPVFRQFDWERLYQIGDYLSTNKLDIQGLGLGDLIEQITDEFDDEVSEIKSTIFAFIAADCFVRTPEQAKLPDQQLSFIHHSTEKAMEQLEGAMRQKLNDIIEEVNDEVFRESFDGRE